MATVPFCCGKPFAPARRGHPVGRRPSRLAQNTKFIRRGGFHIRPRAFAPPQGPAVRPPGQSRPFRLAQNKKIIRRGGIYPACGRSRRRRVPGTISGLRAGPCGPVGLRNAPAGAVRASSPTEVCYNAGPRFSRLAAGPPSAVGEGFIPPAGVCGGAGSPGPI